MANTYTQIHIHIVFAVKGRQSLLPKKHKEELYKYITGVVQNCGHKMLIINGMPDHIHFFIGQRPNQTLSALVQKIKISSSLFINEHRWTRGKFSWQKGYGAFSYSRSQIDAVVKYIANQEQHHKKQTFKEEYLNMLEKFAVDSEERFLFEWIDE